MSGGPVFINEDAAKHRARVLANKRLKRAHNAEWLRYFEDELRRTRGGNPDPEDVA